MVDLTDFPEHVENARQDFAAAGAIQAPEAAEFFRHYWELLRDFSHAQAIEENARPAQEPGEDVLIWVRDEEDNEEGLMPKWFADRARETWGAEPLTEERLWQLIAIDDWRVPRWASALSQTEAVATINKLLVERPLLKDMPAPGRVLADATEAAPTVEPPDVTTPGRRGGAKRPPRDHSELLTKLTEGVAALANSEEWQRHLKVQARFHHYSAQNVDLILIQKSEATQVAGFETWRKLGRFPKKGTGIRILAPMIHRDTDDETGERTSSIRGFRFVNVFDVSDTYGDPLPEVTKKIEGQDAGYLFEMLASFAPTIGFSVIDHDFPDNGPNGDCNFTDKVIRVSASNSGAQRVKTLAHEFGHALMHEDLDNRELGELEAESTAFVVCQALGIDSGDYSFGYVTGWAGGGDEAIANIMQSSARIQKTADRLLAHCEEQFELTLAQELKAAVELTPTEPLAPSHVTIEVAQLQPVMAEVTHTDSQVTFRALPGGWHAEVYPEGGQSVIDDKGEQLYQGEIGIVTDPETSAEVTIWPNGRVLVRQPDGVESEISPDGTTVARDQLDPTARDATLSKEPTPTIEVTRPPKPGIAALEAAVEAAKHEVEIRQVGSLIDSMTNETAIREAVEEVAACEDELDRARDVVASLRAGVVLEGIELRRFESEVRAEVARAERIAADRDGVDPREFASRRLGQSILELRRAHKDARPVSEERERLRIQLEGAEKAYAVVIDENAHPAILEAVITNVALDNEMDPEWLGAQKIVLERDAIREPAPTRQPSRGISN